MLDFVPFELRYKYPHMMPLDVAIWERFIRENPAAFEEVAYDVAVGEGTPHDTIVNSETGGDINRLYQRKIDVVAKAGDQLFIIEVKPRASTAAIGQVKGYARLFKRDFPALPEPRPMILTDEMLPEMQFLATEEGVPILLA